jgi:Phytanoyl-CoA dioxygenase (PhyH)
MSEPSHWRTRIDRDGFAVLRAAFSATAIDAMSASLTELLSGSAASILRSETGSVFGARNLLQDWPTSRDVWRQSPLQGALADVLGPAFGLVRVLYFDKPPDRSWSLPWHKDLTVAVRDNRLPSSRFTHPTRKAGVPHVEAPTELLETMLTARIHLDPATDENGPLKVIPGSHAGGKKLTLGKTPPQTILAVAGDVLLIRPLVAHSSGNSRPETRQHRRILHLEFAAQEQLPDGYAWHDFIACSA